MTDQAPTPGELDAAGTAPHGARWSKRHAADVLDIAGRWLPPGSLVLDPFAGTGEAFHHTMGPAAGWRTLGVEIEAPWAAWNPCQLPGDPWPDPADLTGDGTPALLGNVCADSTTMPGSYRQLFAGVVTSPPFDLRQNDPYVGVNDYAAGRVKLFTTKVGKVTRPNRANYAAQLGAPLAPGNAARYRGSAYRRITSQVLTAAIRATAVGGVIIAEMKDSLELRGPAGRQTLTRVANVDWLLRWLLSGSMLPITVVEVHALGAQGYRNGANRDQRVALTHIVVAQVTG